MALDFLDSKSGVRDTVPEPEGEFACKMPPVTAADALDEEMAQLEAVTECYAGMCALFELF